MEKEQLCDSLMIWLNTFNITVPHGTVDDLTNGIAMSQALAQIAPDFFNPNWLAKIKSDTGSNWRLKVSNLKKILKGILDFYSDVLGQHINDFHMPDVNAVGENSDAGELGRLLQLILGCAVNCSDKQEYIQRIMAMEESVQHVVMNAIQELMTKESPANMAEGYSEIGEQLKRTVDELNTVMESKEELAQKCHELDMQVAILQDEKASLVQENEKLSEKINQSESLDDPSTAAGRRYQQLQHQVEQQQDEMFRIEAARDDYRIKMELQEKELLEFQQKNEELSSLAEEARTLKDEVDVLRHSSDKLAKYESTIETYKKKLDDLGDVKRQLKLLEEKNTSYMETNMELEEEVKKAQSFRSQLEMYKRQTQELQTKISAETKRADKAEFEFKRTQEKMSSVQREKERLVVERDSLKETNEELTMAQMQQGSSLASMGVGEGESLAGGLDLMNMPPEAKERIIRLQHEVKMLKLQREGSEDEKLQMLESMLDDANARKNELETENRIANQRILEMEAEVEDLRENQSANANVSSSNEEKLKKKLNEQSQSCKDLTSEVHTLKGKVEDLDSRLSSTTESLLSSEEQLKLKDEELKETTERYKKYLEKARMVIKALDPKHNQGASPELQSLKSKIDEKDRLIEHLEKGHEKAKSVREQEEKLIVSAWYNLGVQLHRKAAGERLNNSGTGQSFLARQRQAHTRRGQTINASHPGSARSSEMMFPPSEIKV